MAKPGAPAAFRGYRLQTLYILYRILNNDDENNIFIPEGAEDLLIKNSSKVIHDIQIKARESSDLALSHFKIDKKDNLFKRVCQYKDLEDTPTITILSFNNIGKELKKVFIEKNADSQDYINRVKAKLAKSSSGFSTEEIEFIINNVGIKQVSEDEIYDEVIKKLNELSIACSSEDMFDNLMYYLYVCSENKIKIHPNNFKNHIIDIGTTINAQMQYKSHWGSTLEVLSDAAGKVLDKDAYINGSYTKFYHISNNFDIERKKLLNHLHMLQTTSNVLIVHGASGQGKTSLCYRYLANNFPDNYRYMLKDLSISTYKEVYEIAQCMKGVADNLSNLNQPLALYIDANPRQSKWIELIKEIAYIKNIYVIVSIREEDYSRVSHLLNGFIYEDVRIEFTKEEALDFYNLFQTENGVDVNFEESWNNFKHGSLMEYLYMLRKGESLKDRLTRQIQRLRADNEYDAVEILKLVSHAAYHRANLSISSLVQLFPSSLQKNIEYLENEYLICKHDDGLIIDGLHYIRSKIINEIFINEITNDETATISTCLPIIAEDSLEYYLISIFYEKKYTHHIINHMTENHLWVDNWFKLSQVIKASIWNDVYKFIDINSELIKSVIEEFGNGWTFVLGFDLLGQEGIDKIFNSFYEIIAKANKVTLEEVKENKKKYTDSIIGLNTLFNDTQKLFTCVYEKNISLITTYDCKGFSYICACKFYNIFSFEEQVSIEIDTLLDSLDLTKYKLEDIGEIIQGIYYEYPEKIKSYIIKNMDVLLDRFRELHSIVNIVEEDDDICITMLFPYPLDDYYNDEKKFNNNDKVVAALELLHKLIPYKQTYSSLGIAHNIIFEMINIDIDDTKKHINFSNFKDTRVTMINRIYSELGNNLVKHSDWAEFIENHIKLINTINEFLDILNKELKRFFKYDKFNSIYSSVNGCYEGYIKKNNNSVFKPMCISNKYGYVTDEKIFKNSTDSEKNKRKAKNDFISTLNNIYTQIHNFIQQSKKANVYYLYDSKCDEKQQQVVRNKYDLKSLKDNIRLQFYNMMNVKKEISILIQSFNDNFINIQSNLKERFEDQINVLANNIDKIYYTYLGIHYKYTCDYYKVEKQSEDTCNSTILDFIEKFKIATISDNENINVKIKTDNSSQLVVDIDYDNINLLDSLIENIKVFLLMYLPALYRDDPFLYFYLENNCESICINMYYKKYFATFTGMIINTANIAVSEKFNFELSVANHSTSIIHDENRLDYIINISYSKLCLVLRYIDALNKSGEHVDEAGISFIKTYIENISLNDISNKHLNDFQTSLLKALEYISDIDSDLKSDVVDIINNVNDTLFAEEKFVFDEEKIDLFLSAQEHIGVLTCYLSTIIIDNTL